MTTRRKFLQSLAALPFVGSWFARNIPRWETAGDSTVRPDHHDFELWPGSPPYVGNFGCRVELTSDRGHRDVAEAIEESPGLYRGTVPVEMTQQTGVIRCRQIQG